MTRAVGACLPRVDPCKRCQAPRTPCTHSKCRRSTNWYGTFWTATDRSYTWRHATQLHGAADILGEHAVFICDRLAGGIGGSRGTSAQAPSAEQAVRQVEDRRIKAMIDDDFATLEAILADDLTYGHSSRLADTKASYLETLRSGKTKYLTFDRARSVMALVQQPAIITGATDLSLRGQEAPFTLRYTLAYVMREGQWRMVAWQSTRLP